MSAALLMIVALDALWPLFGSANQLLASLRLLAITVWLAKSGKSDKFVKYPMYFMFCVTLTALGFQAYTNFVDEPRNVTLVVASLILFGIAITLVVNAVRSLRNVAKTA
ncbi:MAG: carbon starvation CstA family protein [Planctomycetota bacterium]|jgi:carbon starvation protein